MRTLYDSTNANDIPTTARMVAGYLDGIYRWSGQDWARFATAVRVGIACFASTDSGQVLDVEAGCAIPAEAPGWVQRRRAAGIDPTIYVNRSNWALTRACFIQQGVAEPHYWLAAYDGIAEIPAGTVAKQYANSAMSGGHYDLSAVADYWPGVDPYNPTATAGSEIIVPQEVDLTQQEHDWLALLVTTLAPGVDINDRTNWPNYLGWSRTITKGIADIEAAIRALPAQQANLQPVLDAVTALKGSLPTHVSGTFTGTTS